MLEGLLKSIRKNHFAQMAVCCMLPVILIIALQLLGFTGLWVYPLALLVCVGSHAVMTYFGLKEGKSCH